MIVLSYREWKKLYPQDFAFGFRVRNRPVRCTSHARRIERKWKRYTIDGIDKIFESWVPKGG